ncbi:MULTISPECIES: DUF2271 domain-containing protein [unclassified Colwellia]|uniref:DUF2271 domain-containing protein n=1 Tax=unclassified Colwellia TaxID=196834 RepID=UPI0015F54302|nr:MULTISPECIES: DUF2271 domain-containing protein [unclassified Colwellia]MBA6231189.1 DUF2271 domain-containing protein [Colwellia sp. MB02u-7]MBA6235042.1 DUF2271 domain-containing protein [Colwellia sp. MB02u-11]MBA6257574.1 DUF2271 domain-containing protein [Colwellia sp. MB3u-28]MBA6260646.1 DUF2271 domain-containing protein [Colwellia sp. MB3u-41]MBA6301749.1 DUF2271 domain-containing protein [Colwellia sp. MB3u-22]
MNIKTVRLLLIVLTFINFTVFANPSNSTPAELNIELNLKQQLGEYHPPYVASWIENSQGNPVRTLLLWREKAKWLKDIRRWWRKVGKKDAEFVDGITSATRAAGKYPLNFLAQDDRNTTLKKGQYTLFIEVVRENGGRSIIRQPFTLNGEKETFTLAATHETDEMSFSVSPR